MEGRDSLRLFCALRLPGAALDRLEAWQREHLSGRVVPRGNLHVTVAFLGSRPVHEVQEIVAALVASTRTLEPPLLSVSRYRETRSVGMLELDDAAGTAQVLAVRLHERLELLGVYRPEKRRWLPHVTVLRFRERPGLRPPLPELGAFTPSEAAVYHSVLRPTGAQYDVLESVALGG